MTEKDPWGGGRAFDTRAINIEESFGINAMAMLYPAMCAMAIAFAVYMIEHTTHRATQIRGD